MVSQDIPPRAISMVIIKLFITENPSPSGQNGHHFADGIFKCIFINERFCISIQISLKFVPKDLINNNSALVQVMAWHRTGDKPLPEPMVTQFTHEYMQHYVEMS